MNNKQAIVIALVGLNTGGCAAIGSAESDEVRPTPIAARDLGYTGTTRWVAERDIRICSSGPYRDCTSAPAGTPYVFEQPLYNDSVSRERVDVYRVRDPQGKQGYIGAADAFFMLDAQAKKVGEQLQAECDRQGPVTVGMTAAQVQSSCWGRPEKVNETVTASGRTEQWIYKNAYVYFRNGAVSAIQRTR